MSELNQVWRKCTDCGELFLRDRYGVAVLCRLCERWRLIDLRAARVS